MLVASLAPFGVTMRTERAGIRVRRRRPRSLVAAHAKVLAPVGRPGDRRRRELFGGGAEEGSGQRGPHPGVEPRLGEDAGPEGGEGGRAADDDGSKDLDAPGIITGWCC